MAAQWRTLVETALKTRDAPPFHLKGILSALKSVQGVRPAESMAILDHGCGGGSTLIYLLALGYRGIHGVDIGDSDKKWNRLLQEELGIREPRFFQYDGHRLPLQDGSMDYIFSQQVLEHVHPSVVNQYYSEEGRVLRTGGAAFHQVPHRLVPYESHTRTWFIHYFPKAARKKLYKMCGCDPDYVEGMLHLRMPSFHLRQLERHVGDSRNVTAGRLADRDVLENHEGPKALRRLLAIAVTLPLVGTMAGEVLKHLVMLETISIKRGLQAAP
jgi:SAM-dependent methyltransferase